MPKNVRDLIAVTGLCKETIYAGIRTGELPGYRVGSTYTIPDEAFEDFIHGRWVPKPRPYFAEPVKPLPQAADFIHRKSQSGDDTV